MTRTVRLAALLLPCLLAACSPFSSGAPDGGMSFFVTSAPPGRGGDLGGLAGADAHCQRLARTAGADARTWRAYLSTSATPLQPAVNARDRIGTGPWLNAVGDVIARDLDELHGPNNLGRRTALTERGDEVPGSTDRLNQHGILTGSRADGRALGSGEDGTCRGWTSSGSGTAIVGHHDRQGTGPDARSWNSARVVQGCSPDSLARAQSAGLFYCFATR
jgi:hypothetical protein